MSKISPAMLAEALGVPTQAIRVGLQKGALKCGIAMQQTGKQYTYIIYPEKVREIVGDKKMAEWGF